MKVLKNSKINFLVKTIIDDENILSLNPIIAGGFISDMYNVVKLYDTSDKWDNFKNKFKKDPYLAYDKKFGDIDMYFFNDNDIIKRGNKYNWLMHVKTFYDFCNHWDKSLMANRRYLESYWANGKPIKYQVPDNAFKFKSGIVYPNAIEFTRQKSKSEVEYFQFCRKPYLSIEKLLERFDIVNCTIAWYNDKIYYHDSIEHIFSNKEFELTEAGWNYISSKSDMYYRLYNALRAFKYIDRYDLKFSDKVLNHITKVSDDYNSFDISSERISGPYKGLDTMIKKLRRKLETIPNFHFVSKHILSSHLIEEKEEKFSIYSNDQTI